MKILDFIKQKQLQEIQDLFSTATGLAAVTIDQEGKYLTEGSNSTDFCIKYTKGTRLGKERCEKCDAEGSGTYFCHAGLMDFSEDIIVNGEKLGAIIGGQVLPNPPDIQKFEAIAEELGIPKDKYIKALEQVPIKSEKEIRASSKLFGEIMNMLINLEYIQNRDKNKITTMDSQMVNVIKNAEDIKKKTQELEGIAKRQNILALNASIESARAGEAGRGFAIVAGEMGALAKQSAEMFNVIQKNTESISQAMESINKAFS